MFDKMTFQNDKERDDFEKYRLIKGDDLYYQICRILLEHSQTIHYATVRAYIRYDKKLRNTLYIYLATLEEYCRAQLLNLFDVQKIKKYSGHCYNELMNNLVDKESIESNLYYLFNPDFGDLMHICNEKGAYEIDEDDQKEIKQIRNQTMHHSLLIFGNSKNEKDLFDYFVTLEKRLNALAKALPKDYQSGFLSDISLLNKNLKRGTKHLNKFCLEVRDGRICIKK